MLQINSPSVLTVFKSRLEKDKAYMLTRKKVNNSAFVYWMISWAGRDSLTISDFSSLTCDQAVLRFSHFLWEAWSQVISIFATSNVNKNRFHCLIECHINTIIYKQKGNNIVYLLSYKLGKTAGSLHASYLPISSTKPCGLTYVSYPGHSYPKLRWFVPIAKMIRTHAITKSLCCKQCVFIV